MYKILICTICTLLVTIPANPLSIRFYNVGHGDAALITTDSGRNILVDTGLPDREFIQKILPQKKLDLLVLSHADTDHCGNVLAILKQCRITAVMEPGFPALSPMYRKMLTAMDKRNIRVIFPGNGQIRTIDNNTSLHFLSPPGQLYRYTRSDCNNNSLIFILRYRRWRILFSGDAEKTALNTLFTRYPKLRYDYLKVPHHGSRTGFVKKLYLARGLQAAFISCADSRNARSRVDGRIEAICSKQRIRLVRTSGCKYIELRLTPKGASIRRKIW